MSEHPSPSPEAGASVHSSTDHSTGPDLRPIVAVLLGVHIALIVCLPMLTGRQLDVSVGRFPDVSSVFWLLTLPAALSMIFLAVVVAANGEVSWRPPPIATASVPGLSTRLRIAVAVVTIVAGVGAVRGVADVGLGLGVAVLVTTLLVAVVEEFVIRTLGSDALERRGWSTRHRAVVTSTVFVPVSLAHVFTEGATTFPVVMVTLASGPALFLLTRWTGSSIVPVAVRTLVVFGLVVGRFGPDPQQHLESLVGLVVVAAAAIAGVIGVRRLPAESTADDAPSPRHRGRTAVFVSAAVLGPIAALLVVPVASSGLGAESSPAATYPEALERFDQMVAVDDRAGVFEPCRSELMDHGKKTEQVVVLYHGLTNCPKQFIELGEELFASGANVLILRAPRHGLTGTGSGDADSVGSVDLVGRLTAHELRDFADDAVDIAQGLGDEVVVSGLSMGGVLALWTAQFRTDVDRVVAIAPAISIPPAPHFLTTAFINLFSRVPNLSLPSSGKLDHAYHGESTGALAAMFLLAQATGNEMTTGSAAANEVIVVLNPNDDQVDNDAVESLVGDWTDSDGLVAVVLLPDIGLPHDVIDEDQPTGNADVVYPILFPLIRSGLDDS